MLTVMILLTVREEHSASSVALEYTGQYSVHDGIQDCPPIIDGCWLMYNAI